MADVEARFPFNGADLLFFRFARLAGLESPKMDVDVLSMPNTTRNLDNLVRFWPTHFQLPLMLDFEVA